jgi:mRNA interferase MazF
MNPALLRLTIEPTSANGLREVSQVMTDKVTTTQRSKIGRIIGQLNASQMREIDVRLAAFFGLA